MVRSYLLDKGLYEDVLVPNFVSAGIKTKAEIPIWEMGNGRTDPGIWPDAPPASVPFPGSGHADAMPPGKNKTWILMHAGPSAFPFFI